MKEIFECKIKKLNNFEDFAKVFNAYSYFPYYEEWKKEEIRQEYENHVKDGYVFGCYYNDKCVGLLTMGRASLYKHPICFENTDDALYISNMIVMLEHRYHGFGTALAEFAVDFAKNNDYKVIYFRYRERHEFGKNIAKKLGFSKRYDVCEEIIRPRTKKYHMDDYNEDIDLRFFMSKNL